jgi:hypothetical protein
VSFELDHLVAGGHVVQEEPDATITGCHFSFVVAESAGRAITGPKENLGPIKGEGGQDSGSVSDDLAPVARSISATWWMWSVPLMRLSKLGVALELNGQASVLRVTVNLSLKMQGFVHANRPNSAARIRCGRKLG